MIVVVLGLVLFVAVVAILSWLYGGDVEPKKAQRYFYSKKDQLMTDAEWRFYERLSYIAKDRYLVFPQIHLSSLLRNETKGKYYKLAFQRINRRSVDFVLCSIETRKPVYAVELDDRTHDTASRRARDGIVEDMLEQAGIPLLRFRDVNYMSDEQIIEAFKNVASEQKS